MFKLSNNEFYVVAEIANAAQGIYEENFKLIDLAKRAGANAIKLQFYKYRGLDHEAIRRLKFSKE